MEEVHTLRLLPHLQDHTTLYVNCQVYVTMNIVCFLLLPYIHFLLTVAEYADLIHRYTIKDTTAVRTLTMHAVSFRHTCIYSRERNEQTFRLGCFLSREVANKLSEHCLSLFHRSNLTSNKSAPALTKTVWTQPMLLRTS